MEKAKPSPQPAPTAAAPTNKNSTPALHLFRPSMVAFSKPSPNNSEAPMQTEATQGWSSLLRMPEVTIYGRTGSMPNIINEKKVTIPHLRASLGSMTTSQSSSSIMMLTNACLLVEQSSATRLASQVEYPFFLYISIISFFQSSNKCSTSQYSRSSSDLIYPISAFAERQSPRPMLIASPMQKESAQTRMFLAGMPAERLLRIMTRVFVVPSTPPQTNDFMSYPIWMWDQMCQGRVTGRWLTYGSSNRTSVPKASLLSIIWLWLMKNYIVWKKQPGASNCLRHVGMDQPKSLCRQVVCEYFRNYG